MHGCVPCTGLVNLTKKKYCVTETFKVLFTLFHKKESLYFKSVFCAFCYILIIKKMNNRPLVLQSASRCHAVIPKFMTLYFLSFQFCLGNYTIFHEPVSWRKLVVILKILLNFKLVRHVNCNLNWGSYICFSWILESSHTVARWVASDIFTWYSRFRFVCSLFSLIYIHWSIATIVGALTLYIYTGKDGRIRIYNCSEIDQTQHKE